MNGFGFLKLEMVDFLVCCNVFRASQCRNLILGADFLIFFMNFRGQKVVCSLTCALFLLLGKILLVGIMRRLEILSICI